MNLFLASSITFVAQEIAQNVFQLAKNKKLLFVPTAAEAEEGDKSWLDADRQALIDADFDVSDYSITGQNESVIGAKLSEVGSICVAGGNSYYLLHQTRKSGFDRVVKKAVAQGLIYIGSSAGSLLTGPNIETSLDDPNIAPELTDYAGLGLTDVAVRPHWGNEYFRERYHQELDRLYGLKHKMILLNDLQYLHVRDNWYQIVTVKPKHELAR